MLDGICADCQRPHYCADVGCQGVRTTMRLGESVVHGTVERVDHGGLSVFVRVDGYEKYAMWFATPPWTSDASTAPLTGGSGTESDSGPTHNAPSAGSS
jgi:hypothetical protein